MITCPHCNQQFDLEGTMKESLLAKARKDVEQGFAAKLKDLQESARAAVRLAHEAEVKAQARVTEALQQAEEDARAREQAAQAKEAERAAKEIRVIKENAQLKESLALDRLRQFDQEKEAAIAAALAQRSQGEDLRVRELQVKLESSLAQARLLEAKLLQGSQQAQGEALEIEMEAVLKQAFPEDQITEVPKGVNGADLIHRVGSSIIVWESKRTKSWGSDWITKLKRDTREAGGVLSVLVSTVLPKGIAGFGYMDGVWVVKPEYAVSLATALRQGLLVAAVHSAKASTGGETHERVFTYVTSPKFTDRISAIMDTITSMKARLDSEKKASARSLAERESSIDFIVTHMAGMYGDVVSIVGDAAHPVPALAEV